MKMFIYAFGPVAGGGVVVVPHKSQNGTYRLLGACFFVGSEDVTDTVTKLTRTCALLPDFAGTQRSRISFDTSADAWSDFR